MNVTPLIDVVLVLLIIFMVVTPTVEARFKLALPEVEDNPPELQEDPPPSSLPLIVHLSKAGALELNGEAMEEGPLLQRLGDALRVRKVRVAFFDADEDANFGRSVEVMDLCRGVGATHIGVIDPEAMGSDLPEAPAEVPAPTQPPSP